MSDCTRLSDRMPAVALGRVEWAIEELQHLSDCDSCRREWQVVQLTSALGDEVLSNLNAPDLSTRVLRRLGRSGKTGPHRRSWGLAGLAAAAALGAILWIGREPGSSNGPTGSAVARLEIPLPELEELQPAELDSVLHTMDEPTLNGASAEDPDLGDLEGDELERVLDYWEG